MLVHAAGDNASKPSVESVEFELEETARRLEQLKAEIAQSRVLKDKLAQTLKDVSGKASERASRLQDLDKQLSAYTQQLNTLGSMIESERALLGSTKDRLGDALRNSLQVNRGSGLKVLLQSDDPALASRINVYTEYFLLAQHRVIEQHLSTLSKIESAHAEALKNRNWVHYLKKKATKQHLGFVTKRESEKQSLQAIEKTLDSKTRTVAELNADQERLQLLMEELRKAQLAASGYFEAGKGRYALPVNGSIDARFGDIKSVGKLRWSGLFIQADVGSEVRSIADGEVVYSNWLQGFGMLVIVDHGDSYMTLYGGNRDVQVAQGTWVEAGATIATVGDSGGQKHSGLYFEIRQNAKPVDPEQWVSAENRFKSAKL